MKVMVCAFRRESLSWLRFAVASRRGTAFARVKKKPRHPSRLVVDLLRARTDQLSVSQQ